MTFERKLQIQLGKALTKGHVTNATLGVPANDELQKYLRANEYLVATVKSRFGLLYYFTNQRTVQRSDEQTVELFRYEEVRAAHWMFKDTLRRIADSPNPQMHATKLKSDHYDRIVVETRSNDVVLEGLEQAYAPILQFLKWISSTVPA